jgi:molybdopterin converting factor small subunit
MAHIRFFAAAADVIGVPEREIEVSSVGQLRALVTAEYGLSAAKVVSRCSILVSGVRAENDDVVIGATDTVDVLPPFAGG